MTDKNEIFEVTVWMKHFSSSTAGYYHFSVILSLFYTQTKCLAIWPDLAMQAKCCFSAKFCLCVDTEPTQTPPRWSLTCTSLELCPTIAAEPCSSAASAHWSFLMCTFTAAWGPQIQTLVQILKSYFRDCRNFFFFFGISKNNQWEIATHQVAHCNTRK